MKKLALNVLQALCVVCWLGHATAADLPYVNFENHPIHALDLSPNGNWLAATHTADQRVQLFDTSATEPVSVGSVVVGVDPVSARFRNDDELWVVNHISDSISVIDVKQRRVLRVLRTLDEPFDVVFAMGKAFVSCSQVNTLQVFDLQDLSAAPRAVDIQAEDPRALAVSPDGRFVYAAIFESGNASTTLQGGFSRNEANLANVVNDSRGPYGGQNPPPNAGDRFNPPLNAAAPPPKVGLIVKRKNNQWLDDNNRDWMRFVSGDLATLSGRVAGWTVVDRDLAIIDATTLAVRYETQMMNMVMNLAVKPNGEVTLIGTDASNEIRYEPNLNAKFVKSMLARVTGTDKLISDLNPHLSYQQTTLASGERSRSVGDPRALVWNQAGTRGYVVGMGSNNVAVINGSGQRIGDVIRVGEGPTAAVLHERSNRLLVWNHFNPSLSVVDLSTNTESARIAVFNPLPAAIRNGRKFLYDTHLTSGLGQASCASCHVDARMDKLAWDLGDPSHAPAPFDQNCSTSRVAPCQPFHAMKGPMSTQTMQDIIGHEPLHWRGDRASIEAFNPTFTALMGNDRVLRNDEMAALKAYLRTIAFPPNPYRNLDNSLPENLALKGQRASGRFAMRGSLLPNGNAKRGLQLYTQNFLDSVFQCAACHTLPTGMAPNGPILASILGVPVGGGSLPLGPNGENHLGVVSTDGFSNVSMKVPQTRNMHEKIGAEFSASESLSGFGFAHDGSVGSLADFFSATLFSPTSDQDVADLIALTMAFSGSEFPMPNPALSAAAPLSNDAHAGVGLQVQVTSAALPDTANLQLQLARANKLDLVVTTSSSGFYFDAARELFVPDNDTPGITLAHLATHTYPQVWSLVSKGLGRRIALDRDGDGVGNSKEITQGSSPADAASNTTRALSGMWFNPERSGHGFDLQYAGEMIFVTWFTYDNDGLPTWYQAAGPQRTENGVQVWSGKLNRFVLNADARPTSTEVGELTMRFTTKAQGRVDWRVGDARGSEALRPLIPESNVTQNRTGNWYSPAQSGWGLGIYTQGQTNFTVMYFYDGNQQPRWVVGQGAVSDTPQLPMLALRGACPQCAYTAPTNTPAGTVQLSFDGTRKATVQTDVASNATPNSRWVRSGLAIEPLSSRALIVEWQ
jgi:YVTN family beta-propeller protein